jgi:hypothetical protein
MENWRMFRGIFIHDGELALKDLDPVLGSFRFSPSATPDNKTGEGQPSQRTNET